jgi:D-alanyl-D-alanine carboxypeptidase
LKAAQLLERGFNSNHALSWLMPPLGTVESMAPVDADPPNLREEMCGRHRKRPAAENEDEFVTANMAPDSPYAVFLSSLRPSNAKGASLLHDVQWREPVLVFTGTKPPVPGAASAAAKPKTDKKKTAAKPPAAKDGAASTPASAAVTAAGDATAARPKPKPKATAAKPPAAKDGAASTPAPTAVTGAADAAAARPKPKPKATGQKPAPKPAPAAGPATQHTSQAR